MECDNVMVFTNITDLPHYSILFLYLSGVVIIQVYQGLLSSIDKSYTLITLYNSTYSDPTTPIFREIYNF